MKKIVILGLIGMIILFSGCFQTKSMVSGETLAKTFEIADKSVPKISASMNTDVINPLLDMVKDKSFTTIDEIRLIYKNSSLKLVSEAETEKTNILTFEAYKLLIVELKDDVEAKAFVLQMNGQLEEQYSYNGRAAYAELCNWYKEKETGSNLYVFQTGKFVLISKDLASNI